MKKRFTIMLDTKALEIIKKYRNMITPTSFREELQDELEAWATWQIENFYPEEINTDDK